MVFIPGRNTLSSISGNPSVGQTPHKSGERSVQSCRNIAIISPLIRNRRFFFAHIQNKGQGLVRARAELTNETHDRYSIIRSHNREKTVVTKIISVICQFSEK